jgi:hypothetical protein
MIFISKDYNIGFTTIISHTNQNCQKKNDINNNRNRWEQNKPDRYWKSSGSSTSWFDLKSIYSRERQIRVRIRDIM